MHPVPACYTWLARKYPAKSGRVQSLIRSVRGGRLNDPSFGSRIRGQGPLAEKIRGMYKVFTKRFGLDGDLPDLDLSQFRPPRASSGQLSLF